MVGFDWMLPHKVQVCASHPAARQASEQEGRILICRWPPTTSLYSQKLFNFVSDLREFAALSGMVRKEGL